MFSINRIGSVFTIILIVACFISFCMFSYRQNSSVGTEYIALSTVSPFQEIGKRIVNFLSDIWNHYFNLVSAAKENEYLKKQLAEEIEKKNEYQETFIENDRLRRLLDLTKSAGDTVCAEVIGRDPSAWYETIIVNKGRYHGVTKGMPVIVSEGIAGMVSYSSDGYSKVLLMIDRNCAVDARIQRTRVRGIVKGESENTCKLEYVLKRFDVKVGDTVISSGIDGIFPKGLRIGTVSEIMREETEIFQKIKINPFVEFEKLEEVMIVLKSAGPEFTDE